MSDPTKKSIVINKSFLSGNDSSNSSLIKNNRSKKNTRMLSEEIIKPNKLKKMLLDKINAKRKADLYSSPNGSSNSNSNSSSNNNTDSLDISKETRLFSSEFKKSLDFLDSYIGQKRNDNNKSKTLKKNNNNSTSLNTDILKSLHNNNIKNNNNGKPSTIYPTNNITQPIQAQTYTHQPIQPIQIMQPVTVQANPQSGPIFQKIQLQIPSKSQTHGSINESFSPNMGSKINLSIGKTANQNMVYTELPPELQNFTPPVYNISSPSLSPISPVSSFDTLPPLMPHTNFEIEDDRDDRDARDSREMVEIEDNNTNTNTSKTSLSISTSTFSPIKLTDDAPYGCLKDGKKPTFRMYNKTIKNNLRFTENDSSSDNIYSDRQTKLRDLQNKHGKKTSIQDNKKIDTNSGEKLNSKSEHDDSDDDNEDSKNEKNNNHLRRTKIRRHLRKTITKKFKLGKQQGNIVGVLIKNNDTRKNIQKEHGLLKNKQLADIKKYLVEKNLIKIGSTAPPGVIRNIYEASMLSGEVENVGKGVSLHNFLEDKKSW